MANFLFPGRWRHTPALVASSLLMLVAQVGHAAIDWGASVELGAQYEDNPDLRPANDEESDIERNLGLNVDMNGEGSRYQLAVDYRFLHRDYQDNVIEDDTAIDGTTNFTFALLRSLDFVLEHQISELRSDLAAADTAENRDNRSVLSTGLDWTLALSRVDQVVIAPRFVQVQIEDADDSDSDRANLAVSWLRQTSEVAQFSLTAQHQDVSFDDDSFDYQLDSFSVGYDTRLTRLGWGVRAGYTDISRDESEDTDGTNLRLDLSYDTDTERFGVVWLSEITDSVIGFSSEGLDFDDFTNNDNNFDEIDILRRDEFQLFYNKRFNASNDLSAQLSWVQEDYEVLLDDQQQLSASLRYSYRVTQRLSLRPALEFTRITFEQDTPERENDELRVTLALNYQLSRAIALNAGVGYEQRDSNITASDEYENTIAFLNAVYTFR